MQKISSVGNKSLFIKFVVKTLLSATVLVLLLSSLSSLILLKLDIDLEYQQYFAYFICAITAFITSYIVLSDFKNNYLLVSVFSSIPFLLFSVINNIVNKASFAIILIKTAVIITFAVVAALVKLMRKRR